MTFYVYILHSSAADKYYIGYSTDPQQRLLSHNNSNKNSFTRKFRPWVLKAQFNTGSDEALAIRVERFIKKKKSRQFIEN